MGHGRGDRTRSRSKEPRKRRHKSLEDEGADKPATTSTTVVTGPLGTQLSLEDLSSDEDQPPGADLKQPTNGDSALTASAPRPTSPAVTRTVIMTPGAGTGSDSKRRKLTAIVENSAKPDDLDDIPLPGTNGDPPQDPPPSAGGGFAPPAAVSSRGHSASLLLKAYKQTSKVADKHKSKRRDVPAFNDSSESSKDKGKTPPQDVDMRFGVGTGPPAGFRTAFQPLPPEDMGKEPRSKVPSTIGATKTTVPPTPGGPSSSTLSQTSPGSRATATNSNPAPPPASPPVPPAPPALSPSPPRPEPASEGQAPGAPSEIEKNMTAFRASAIADTITSSAPGSSLEKRAAAAGILPKSSAPVITPQSSSKPHKKHKKATKEKNTGSSTDLKLSQLAMDLSADSDRQKRINKLSAEKLQKLKDKKKEVEQAYKQDCETFATVVKLLISKDASLEDKILPSLRESLKEIGQKFMQELNQFVDHMLDNS